MQTLADVLHFVPGPILPNADRTRLPQDPPREVIAARCGDIQRTWTRVEERVRRGLERKRTHWQGWFTVLPPSRDTAPILRPCQNPPY